MSEKETVGSIKISTHASGQINITTKGEPCGDGKGIGRVETISKITGGYSIQK